MAIGLDLQSPYVPIAELRKAIAELKMLRPYWLDDYYPLTPINIEQDTWCGWQFNRPDLNAGFAMFFRRPKSAQASYEAKLRLIDLTSTRLPGASSYVIRRLEPVVWTDPLPQE